MSVMRPAALLSYAAKPDGRLKAVLLYGPDSGGVHDLALKLVKAHSGDAADPFNVARLDDQELLRDPARLADEAGAFSFTGGRRTVWVSAAGAGFLKALETLPAAERHATLVVAGAGPLQKGSSLRTRFETEENYAIAPCYEDDDEALNRLIDEELKAARLTIAPEARDRLLTRLGADRGLSRGEVRKLALYALGRGQVTLEDVDAVSGDAGALDIDDLVDAAMEGDLAGADRFFMKLIDEGQDASRLLGAAAMHVALLQKLKAETAAGRPAEAAVRSARGLGLPARQARAIRQVRLWSVEGLQEAGAALNAAVLQSRRHAAIDDAIAGRCFLSVARSAKAQLRPG